MYKNLLKNRWEAKHPNHLIGWQIKLQGTERDGKMVKMVLAKNVGGEQRTCWVHEDIIPLIVTERDYNV